MDGPSRHLRDYEWRSYIRERRRHYNEYPRRGTGHLHDTGDHAPDDLIGIALSGGGIRSATFALGVLQALAQHDLCDASTISRRSPVVATSAPR